MCKGKKTPIPRPIPSEIARLSQSYSIRAVPPPPSPPAAEQFNLQHTYPRRIVLTAAKADKRLGWEARAASAPFVLKQGRGVSKGKGSGAGGSGFLNDFVEIGETLRCTMRAVETSVACMS